MSLHKAVLVRNSRRAYERYDQHGAEVKNEKPREAADSSRASTVASEQGQQEAPDTTHNSDPHENAVYSDEEEEEEEEEEEPQPIATPVFAHLHIFM